MASLGGVDQRFRRDAADVEASPAEPFGFNQDRIEAELAGADRRDIAGGSAADDEDLAAQLVHAAPPSTNSSAGCSMSLRNRWMNLAASKPSTTR